MSVSLTELEKAVDSLQIAIDLYQKSKSDSDERKAFRDSCIQRFEYCIELSWKISMKSLGSTTQAAKPAVREMARANLINNPSEWIDFIEARNKTSHSYDEKTASEVFKTLLVFLPEVQKLLTELKKTSL